MSLPTQPTKDPIWATDANFTNGTVGVPGTATKVEPSAGEKAEGAIPGDMPPAQVHNWWMNLVYTWVLYIKALVTAFFWSPTVGVGLQAARYKVLGTNLGTGDFTIDAAWGTGHTEAAGGTDSAGFLSITAGAGGGLAASPRVILLFKDGAWSNPPIVVANCSDDQGTPGSYPVNVFVNTTQLFFYPMVTPVAGRNYTIRWVAIGKP